MGIWMIDIVAAAIAIVGFIGYIVVVRMIERYLGDQ
jgi:preprotein translocase subunit Sss1